MKKINSALMKKFIDLASKRLTGDWLILGGTVLPVLGVDHRATVDVDLVGDDGIASQEQMLKLMEIAEELGLPVEAINSAGAHFLRKIAGHRAHWIELKKGPGATIYRPDLVLFLQLKIGRLSDTDLEDCLAFLKADPTHDRTKAIQVIEKASKGGRLTSEKRDRLAQLLRALRARK